MSIAICPGSFDPMTLGHLNIVRRTSHIFDRVIVVIMVNASKRSPMFTIEERVDMARRVTARFENVTVDTYDGRVRKAVRQGRHRKGPARGYGL